MPRTSSRRRDRAAQARPPAPAHPRIGRGVPVPLVEQRPLAVPFAAVFGLLVAAEEGYLAWLIWEPGAGLDWFVAVPLALALLALAGAGLLLLGRRWAWLPLAVSSVLLLLALLFLAVLFGVLGGGQALWLLVVGPVGCLALVLRREVRSWRGGSAARRPAGGARRAARTR